jgi:hypothetical protein
MIRTFHFPLYSSDLSGNSIWTLHLLIQLQMNPYLLYRLKGRPLDQWTRSARCFAGSGWNTDWFHRYPQGLSAGHTPGVPLARGHPQMLLREVAQGLDIVKTQILTIQCAILRYITATIQ